MQGLHSKNHTGQGTSQNLWIRKGRATIEVLLFKQTNANAVRDTTAPSRTLIGSSLGDGFHQKLLNLAPEAVALDTRKTRVDHVPNARHGERRLGHIGRQNHSALSVRSEDAVLLGLCEPCKKGQHLRA